MANTSVQFRGYTFNQMLLAIVLLAAIVRVGLFAVPETETQYVTAQRDDATAIHDATSQPQGQAKAEPESIIEVMPFNLQGHLPAPLLASILREHRPELTDQHAGELMDTLPPGSTQRMIVILPDAAEQNQPY